MERVLQIVGEMNRGGVESIIMNVYRHIDREKVQFDFLIHRDIDRKGPYDDEITALGGQIHLIKKPHPHTLPRYFRVLNDFFKTYPYRVTHTHMASTAFINLMAAKRQGVETRIPHAHNTMSESAIKNLLLWPSRTLLRRVSTHLVACSREAGAWLFGEKAMLEGLVNVLPNAINAEAFRFNEDTRKRMRAELGLEEKLVFGHIGRFAEQKNHAFLLDAFRLIKDKLPNAALLLLGEGPLMDAMRQKAESLGLSDSIIFAGVRPNVPDYLQAMDAFLFPSLFEGLGIVLIEAQAAGLPCLAANTITPEARVTGLLEFLPINSAEAWANRAIAPASAMPLRRDMTEAIRNAGYDITAVAQAWLKLYGIE